MSLGTKKLTLRQQNLKIYMAKKHGWEDVRQWVRICYWTVKQLLGFQQRMWSIQFKRYETETLNLFTLRANFSVKSSSTFLSSVSCSTAFWSSAVALTLISANILSLDKRSLFFSSISIVCDATFPLNWASSASYLIRLCDWLLTRLIAWKRNSSLKKNNACLLS